MLLLDDLKGKQWSDLSCLSFLNLPKDHIKKVDIRSGG
ncbi:MAG: hypothetical protein ACI9UV_000800 [Algoriphagus sp.]|jgi:hypothetical protein